MLRFSLIFAASIFFGAGPCLAQAGDHGLRGLKQINLLIERLDNNSQTCGITEALIRDAFMFPVSSSRMQISNAYDVPTFYIQVTTLHDRTGLCVSSINMRAYNFQSLKLTYGTTKDYFKIELWSEGWVGYTQATRHGQRIRETIETLTKKFVTAWNLANKS